MEIRIGEDGEELGNNKICRDHLNWTASVAAQFKCVQTFIKPDQLDPWIKDQLGNALLSTIFPLQLRNFVSCERAFRSHMTQHLVTVGTKLLTGVWLYLILNPWIKLIWFDISGTRRCLEIGSLLLSHPLQALLWSLGKCASLVVSAAVYSGKWEFLKRRIH